MPRLCFKLGNWHCALLMWKKSETPAKYQTAGQEELRRTSTPCQFQVTSPQRTSPMVPNMELPNGNECAAKPRRCCGKLDPSMAGTKPFWKDGTRTTHTASLCQKLGGLKSRFFSMTNLHWKVSPTLQQKRKDS